MINRRADYKLNGRTSHPRSIVRIHIRRANRRTSRLDVRSRWARVFDPSNSKRSY